ncbi:hypothetical protein D3C80_1046480 [compost metagenome]
MRNRRLGRRLGDRRLAGTLRRPPPAPGPVACTAVAPAACRRPGQPACGGDVAVPPPGPGPHRHGSHRQRDAGGAGGPRRALAGASALPHLRRPGAPGGQRCRPRGVLPRHAGRPRRADLAVRPGRCAGGWPRHRRSPPGHRCQLGTRPARAGATPGGERRQPGAPGLGTGARGARQPHRCGVRHGTDGALAGRRRSRPGVGRVHQYPAAAHRPLRTRGASGAHHPPAALGVTGARARVLGIGPALQWRGGIHAVVQRLVQLPSQHGWGTCRGRYRHPGRAPAGRRGAQQLPADPECRRPG